MPALDEMIDEGMMTLEKVQVIAYRAEASKKGT
jgi:PII-like signaling protein